MPRKSSEKCFSLFLMQSPRSSAKKNILKNLLLNNSGYYQRIKKYIVPDGKSGNEVIVTEYYFSKTSFLNFTIL